MKVELRGVNHRNKGAELMLRALVDHFDQQDRVAGDGETAIDLVTSTRVAPRDRRKALDLEWLIYIYSEAWYLTTPRFLPPRFIRRFFSINHPSDIDLLLDGSGFAYGDQWGPARARHSFKYYSYIRKHGGRIVLLPQSFGPFENPEVRDAMVDLLSVCDLVFPRDAPSFQWLRELADDPSRIIQSPDFTPVIHGPAPAGVTLPERAAAIIPNRKMIDQTGATSNEYEIFVADVIRIFIDQGLEPFLLPHADQDHELIQRIKARIDRDVPIVNEPDALRLKGIIGQCHAVMCSRFHGLVSALSQAVPAVATGWSHKYRHLLDEYACPDALFDPSDDRDAMRRRIEAMLEPDNYAALVERLRERGTWHREKIAAMWERIDALVDDVAASL